MALKAGRRGLNKRLVDAFGNLNGEVPSGDYYTKQQTDNKFETKTHVNNTFQKKTLEVPLEMLSGTKLTVEDALQGLNEEITEELAPQVSAVTDIIEGAVVGDLGNYIYKVGKMVWMILRLNGVTTTAWADNTPIAMIPEGYRPRNSLRIFNYGSSDASQPKIQPIQINQAGAILSAANLSNQVVILTATWITD